MQSKFSKYHPAVLFVYFMSVLLICMFTSNPVLAVLALLGCVAFLAVSPGRKRVRSAVWYVALFLLISFANPLFSHNGATPLFFLNGNAVTLEALCYGMMMGVTLVAVLLWCSAYSRVMNMEGFLYLFGKAIPQIALMLSMAIAFIPRFIRHMRRVSAAQKSMGMYLDDGYVGKVKGAMRVFQATVAWSVENSIETSMSMKARGYGMSKKRTSYTLFKFRQSDVQLMVLICVLLCMTLVGIASGEMSFNFYPRVSNVNLSPCAIMTYVSFGVLIFLPAVVEVKEKLTWNVLLANGKF